MAGTKTDDPGANPDEQMNSAEAARTGDTEAPAALSAARGEEISFSAEQKKTLESLAKLVNSL
jgi:hypothetical protein